MADDEDNTKAVRILSKEDQQVVELRQRISQKYTLIQQRMEKQNERLKGVQVRLEQQLAQKSGGNRWLMLLKNHLYSLWWRVRHR